MRIGLVAFTKHLTNLLKPCVVWNTGRSTKSKPPLNPKGTTMYADQLLMASKSNLFNLLYSSYRILFPVEFTFIFISNPAHFSNYTTAHMLLPTQSGGMENVS
jgi:hypothetical protein